MSNHNISFLKERRKISEYLFLISYFLFHHEIYIFANKQVNSLHTGVILHAFFVVCGFFFFYKLTFSKQNLSGIRSGCQIVWIQIRHDMWA